MVTDEAAKFQTQLRALEGCEVCFRKKLGRIPGFLPWLYVMYGRRGFSVALRHGRFRSGRSGRRRVRT